MTTRAERASHNASGLRAADFPCPPIPEMHPNAEWCEAYARWHAAYVRALLKSNNRPKLHTAKFAPEVA